MEHTHRDDELVVLSQLEEDLSAVELAIERLDALGAAENSGTPEDVAAEIAAVVPADRFAESTSSTPRSDSDESNGSDSSDLN